LYVFSSNSKTIQKVLHLTSSGGDLFIYYSYYLTILEQFLKSNQSNHIGAVANDVLMHASGIFILFLFFLLLKQIQNQV